MKSAKPIQPQAPILAVGFAACATVTGSSTENAQNACTAQNPASLSGNLVGPVSHGSSDDSG